MVERAEDAALLLLLLLEQGIDDDDNIIPNAVVVPLISVFRLKKQTSDGLEIVVGKMETWDWIIFFFKRDLFYPL